MAEAHSGERAPLPALAYVGALSGDGRPALFLDYDGTLTPIVRRPSEAVLSEKVRDLLRRLAGLCTVAVVSGRDLRDVAGMVGLEEIVYAGCHGFDVAGPGGLRMQHEGAQTALPDLDAAESTLRSELGSIAGAWLERKRFALAVHYREVAEEDVGRIRQVMERAGGRHPGLRSMWGKRTCELQPDVEWNKGEAVLWLCGALGVRPEVFRVIYIGDDTTDEDAFRVLQERKAGTGVIVADPLRPTHAAYVLRNPDEVAELLQSLLTALERKQDR